METIGITTTIPVEILITAGYRVVDLNNLFITSKDYSRYIDSAERDGFPKSSCAWIKGIYGACVENGITKVVGVMEGDCSNTRALIEVLNMRGINTYRFSYPGTHSLEDIRKSIDAFMDLFKVKLHDVEVVRGRLNNIRLMGKKIDELTYIQGKATGFENHLYQVSLSDFNGDANEYEKTLLNKIKEIQNRKASRKLLRLRYIGVPPMTCDIYDFVEKHGAGIVYNEVQREFAFPRFQNAADIYEQYADYTYPYGIEVRLGEIKNQIKERKLDGIIHYTQAFCHRAIENIVIKNELSVPVLNIEGDKSNELDSRSKIRLEAFIDMLADMKEIEYENTGY